MIFVLTPSLILFPFLIIFSNSIVTEIYLWPFNHWPSDVNRKAQTSSNYYALPYLTGRPVGRWRNVRSCSFEGQQVSKRTWLRWLRLLLWVLGGLVWATVAVAAVCLGRDNQQTSKQMHVFWWKNQVDEPVMDKRCLLHWSVFVSEPSVCRSDSLKVVIVMSVHVCVCVCLTAFEFVWSTWIHLILFHVTMINFTYYVFNLNVDFRGNVCEVSKLLLTAIMKSLMFVGGGLTPAYAFMSLWLCN